MDFMFLAKIVTDVLVFDNSVQYEVVPCPAEITAKSGCGGGGAAPAAKIGGGNVSFTSSSFCVL